MAYFLEALFSSLALSYSIEYLLFGDTETDGPRDLISLVLQGIEVGSVGVEYAQIYQPPVKALFGPVGLLFTSPFICDQRCTFPSVIN